MQNSVPVICIFRILHVNRGFCTEVLQQNPRSVTVPLPLLSSVQLTLAPSVLGVEMTSASSRGTVSSMVSNSLTFEYPVPFR